MAGCAAGRVRSIRFAPDALTAVAVWVDVQGLLASRGRQSQIVPARSRRGSGPAGRRLAAWAAGAADDVDGPVVEPAGPDALPVIADVHAASASTPPASAAAALMASILHCAS